MKRVGFAVLLALWPALNALPAAKDDALLERIAAGLSHSAVLHAEFIQTKTVAALTRPIVTSGRFVYARQQGVSWKIERPYRATYLLTDTGVTELDASGAPVRSADQGPALQHVSRIFRALLEPDFKTLEQYFVPTASGDASRWELTLAPRGPLRQVFKSVRVRGGRFVEALTLDESNGDKMEIRFLAMREAVALEADELRARRRE
jgi:outer membrane lipoprotein-sorting protein